MTLVPTAAGWLILAGGVVVGPFATLREVEDWMDARENQE